MLLWNLYFCNVFCFRKKQYFFPLSFRGKSKSEIFVFFQLQITIYTHPKAVYFHPFLISTSSLEKKTHKFFRYSFSQIIDSYFFWFLVIGFTYVAFQIVIASDSCHCDTEGRPTSVGPCRRVSSAVLVEIKPLCLPCRHFLICLF